MYMYKAVYNTQYLLLVHLNTTINNNIKTVVKMSCNFFPSSSQSIEKLEYRNLNPICVSSF